MSDAQVERYLAAIRDLPAIGNYVRVAKIPNLESADAKLHRKVLMSLLAVQQAPASRVQLPAAVEGLHEEQLRRIRRELDERPDEFYTARNDRFVKDLCIAARRAIWIGGGLAHLANLPVRMLAVSNLQRWPEVARVILQNRGRGPLLELHTHDSDLSRFNEEGWTLSYQLLADVLRLNPEIRGVMRASWFIDPALERVSPRLAYMYKLPHEGGATFFALEVNEKDVALALKKSNTRRRLFQEGKYYPSPHLMIWGRRELLRWAPEG